MQKNQLEETQRRLTEFKLTSTYILQELDKKNEELKTTKNYVTNIINNLTDSLIVIDPDGLIKVANRASLNLLGYKESELIGKPIDIILKDQKTVSFFKNTIIKELRNGVVADNRNIDYINKENKRVPVNLSGSTVKDKDGNIADIVFTARDMQPMNELLAALEEARGDLEKKVEEGTQELRKAQTQLVQTARMATIGQFSAGIAHEVNNPLAGILNCVRVLLADPGIKDQKRGYLELTLKGLLRIENTIKQILSFSSQARFNPRPLNFNQLIEETLQFTRHRLAEKKVVLEKNLDKEIGLVSGDYQLLQQIFMNIINNAVDALSEEGGKLTITTSHRNKEIEINFRDNGKGIKKEYLDRVFDPFFTTKEIGKGVGLGLYLSYNFIQQHQGSVGIQSEEGRFTAVTIKLPILGGNDGT